MNVSEPETKVKYIDVDGQRVPVVEKGKTILQIKPPTEAKEKQPSAFIQKYLMAKEQGFKGSIIDYEKQMTQARMSAAQGAVKDPNLQTKSKTFVDPQTQKTMRQDFSVNPKTGRWEPAKDKDGNDMPPYEVPKSFNILESLGKLGGGANKAESLNAQIQALEAALKSAEEE
jgi:hypothetical protein